MITVIFSISVYFGFIFKIGSRFFKGTNIIFYDNPCGINRLLLKQKKRLKNLRRFLTKIN
ncbi:hypothetical protein D0809_18430 [Flavobacterium circumlabens]|uniref:Uncharacterized protein n=1 Tax=Flavobacterium circumlabens TaxID=2133765 RepID=A0A4Y7U9D2_9FLAO|nr:hypothetical protein D0809_18430 [Flavobacterium circumlabens]